MSKSFKKQKKTNKHVDNHIQLSPQVWRCVFRNSELCKYPEQMDRGRLVCRTWRDVIDSLPERKFHQVLRHLLKYINFPQHLLLMRLVCTQWRQEIDAALSNTARPCVYCRPFGKPEQVYNYMEDFIKHSTSLPTHIVGHELRLDRETFPVAVPHHEFYSSICLCLSSIGHCVYNLLITDYNFELKSNIYQILSLLPNLKRLQICVHSAKGESQIGTPANIRIKTVYLQHLINVQFTLCNDSPVTFCNPIVSQHSHQLRKIWWIRMSGCENIWEIGDPKLTNYSNLFELHLRDEPKLNFWSHLKSHSTMPLVSIYLSVSLSHLTSRQTVLNSVRVFRGTLRKLRLDVWDYENDGFMVTSRYMNFPQVKILELSGFTVCRNFLEKMTNIKEVTLCGYLQWEESYGSLCGFRLSPCDWCNIKMNKMLGPKGQYFLVVYEDLGKVEMFKLLLWGECMELKTSVTFDESRGLYGLWDCYSILMCAFVCLVIISGFVIITGWLVWNELVPVFGVRFGYKQ